MKTLSAKAKISGLTLIKIFFMLAMLAGVAVVGCSRKDISKGMSEEVSISPIKMPDGSVVTITNIAYGKKHVLGYAGSHANLTLDLWFQQTACPVYQMQRDVYFTVTDESGIVHLPAGYGCYQCLTTNCIGERIGDSRFDAFPRQATNLTFYVHSVGSNSQWVIVDSFKLPNPARANYSNWLAEPLPAIRKDGGLAFVLNTLQVRLGVTFDRPKTVSTNDSGTRMIFQVTTNGVSTTDWQPESVELTDNTGNLLYLWAGGRAMTTDGQGLLFASNLWLDPTESAWKIHAEFSHKARYAPDETIIVTNVPAKLDAYLPYDQFNVKLKDAIVNVKRVTGEFNGGFGDNNATVEFGVTPTQARFRIALIKVTDNRGEEIRITRPERGYGDFRGYNQASYGLKLTKESKTLNFTLAYQESRFADFTAKPELIRSAKIGN